MLIRVPVARELIEEAFRTGYTTRGVLTVTEGVPDDARFLCVTQAVDQPGTFIFWFERDADGGEVTRPVSVRCAYFQEG